MTLRLSRSSPPIGLAFGVISLWGCASHDATAPGSHARLADAGASGPIIGLAGKCLDDKGDATDDGNKIQLYRCNGSEA